MTHAAYAEPFFNLTVDPVNIEWGKSTIYLTVEGQFGDTQSATLANSQNPSYTFTLDEAQFPIGDEYKVCISSSFLGSFLPHCEYYTHGGGDEEVSISP
jgi:hypothetical protein